MTRLAAIIVNFRTAEMTLKALDALLLELELIPGARAIIVDNDSADGSYEALRCGVAERGASDRVCVLQSGHNGGFSFGVNHGIRYALTWPDPPDAIYLLNSDAFIDPGGLRALLEYQEQNRHASIAGSYIHGVDGEPHCTSFRFPSLPGELMANLRLGLVGRFLGRWEIAIPWPAEPCRVDWLAGASMLIRKDVLDAVGLFDETYFLYYEETDFCRRAANAGFETWFIPESSVAHIGGGSTDFKNANKPRGRYWFESRRHYLRTHHGEIYLQLTNFVWIASFLLWRVRRRLQRIPDHDPPGLLRDFIRYSFRGSQAR